MMTPLIPFIRQPLLLLLTALLGLSPSVALEVSNVFSDHMVLQQQQPIRVWGRAEPGSEVNVRFATASESTEVHADGTWQLSLPAQEASFESRTLTISSGDHELRFSDVLVGEVWLCSGQSNMDWTVDRLKDADMERLAADHPHIRLYKVNHVTASEPRFSDTAVWKVCAPNTVGDFSGAGYYFGRDLQQILKVPVGLIHSAWGGTPAIAWTRMQAMHKHPQLVGKVAEWEAMVQDFPKKMEVWQKQQDALNAAGTPDPTPWRSRPKDRSDSHFPANLANGMLGPIAPYTVRGAIWYQGETDAGWNPGDYDARLQVMIEDWRERWDQNPFPFGIVQLAAFMDERSEPSNDPWPQLREAQRNLANSMEHLGLAVTIDIGEANDIHPRNKQEVGRRLARWALADVYEQIELRGGPELATARVDGKQARLSFTQVGSGLHHFDAHKLGGFTLAGSDGVFYPATARIDGKNTIVVSSAEVFEPLRVRYAWQNNPKDANLTNAERLPASPFEAWLER